MSNIVAAAAALGLSFSATAAADPLAPPPKDSGIVRVESKYGMEETISRIKADIAAKGIRFFDEIDQAALAQGAGIKLNPAVQLIFGNPPLGIQFLTANPYAGLDWPVRMQVLQDDDGTVWIAWTDFNHIAARYHIKSRDAQFKMASEVATSIASAATR